VLQSLTSITGKTLKRLYIVGGGSKNALLNRLTAKATGLEVRMGSTESATVGNFAVQLASLTGNYNNRIGVTADAVAEWASVLAAQPIDALGNTIRVPKVEETRQRTGEALA
jgi:rhamnulokinase